MDVSYIANIFIALSCVLTVLHAQHLDTVLNKKIMSLLENEQKFDYDVLTDFSDTNILRQVADGQQWLHDEDLPNTLDLLQVSADCSRDFLIYSSELLNLTTWAVRMADSTGRMESGILDGNALFEGRYPECRDAKKYMDDVEFGPLYCVSQWYGILPVPEPGVGLMGSGLALKGSGICIPSTCSDEDALHLMRQVFLRPFPERALINCERLSDDLSSDAAAIVTIFILSLLGGLVLVATIFHAYRKEVDNRNKTQSSAKVADASSYNNASFKTEDEKNDIKMENTETEMKELNSSINNNKVENGNVVLKSITVVPNGNGDSKIEKNDIPPTESKEELESFEKKPNVAERLLMSFSLYDNLSLMLSSKQAPGTYGCLNGIRVIAMCCVVLGHTYSIAYVALENIQNYVDDSISTAFAKVATMEVYVDTFFILSSFLVTISFMKQLKRKNGKLGLLDLGLHYFNRYWRLTPAYAIVLMVFSSLMPYFVNGPFVPENVMVWDSCAKDWWMNLLYINNFTLTPCMGWSWYLAVDMQLFIVAPLFLYILYRWEKAGLLLLILTFLGGVLANLVLWNKYYSQTPDDPDPVDAFQEIYIMPWTRMPVYIMGMLLGHLFYKTNGNIHLNKVIVVCGWIVGAGIYFITAYVPSLMGCVYLAEIYGTPGCTWSVAGRVAWSTMYRPMWGIWVCWLILACSTGYGGLINTVLSWNIFFPLGKLTYLCYLIHYVILLVVYGSYPSQIYFTHFDTVVRFFGVLLITNLCSLVSSVLFMAPLTRLASVFLPSRRDKVPR